MSSVDSIARRVHKRAKVISDHSCTLPVMHFSVSWLNLCFSKRTLFFSFSTALTHEQRQIQTRSAKFHDKVTEEIKKLTTQSHDYDLNYFRSGQKRVTREHTIKIHENFCGEVYEMIKMAIDAFGKSEKSCNMIRLMIN